MGRERERKKEGEVRKSKAVSNRVPGSISKEREIQDLIEKWKEYYHLAESEVFLLTTFLPILTC